MRNPTKRPVIRIVAVAVVVMAGSAYGQQCPLFAHRDRVEQQGNVRTIHCKCDAGYELRKGVCHPFPVMREDTPQMQLRQLRNQAAEEWYWFTVNHFDVTTAAFWALYGYEPQASQSENPDVESMWVEARNRLRNWLAIQHNIEKLQQSQLAQQHFQQRSKNFVVAPHARHAPVSERGGNDTQAEFAPWTKDAQARENGRCIFVGRAAELVCQ